MVQKVWFHSCYILLAVCVRILPVVGENTYVSQGREMVQEFYSRFNSRQVDLVFILDHSASVPRAGWESMLNFVRSVLEYFTISHENTRIAIITFSTRVSIDINDLEEGRENKCSMMRKIQLRLRQKVMSGYTATNVALASAKDILLNSRLAAKKAIFVLTDGKSNIGPAPVQASIELRSLRWDPGWNETDQGPQLEIYAFGIKDAYMPELRSMASQLPNHTYFIPDFRTFEELARSLHEGEQHETWDVISDLGLCEDRCSHNAVCTCATRSGQYLCVCRAGYYGNGFVCTECPRGTFKDTLTPHLCVHCPANSTTLLPGATSPNNCVCQPPYHQDSVRKICQLLSCPSLPEIPNAHKFNVIGRIKDEVLDTGEPCFNSPETSCHYKCDVGHRLDGHPGLICNMNGTWTGHVPQCHVVDCKTLDYHSQLTDHGTVTYLNSTTTYLSVVQVTCSEGWRLFGNATRHCTRHGIWSATPASCIEAQCPAIRQPVGGNVEPSQCSTSRQMPGTHCTITCQSGYSQHGPRQHTCTAQGTWDTMEETNCFDVEDPVITCPADIYTPVTSANYALVHWDAVTPQYSDNSGSDSLQVQIIGVRNSPAQLSVGFHQIKYLVRDEAGNEAFCTQGIHVVEKVVRMESCPENMVIRDIQGSGQEVSWSGPFFLDNNNRTIPHVCSIPSGSVFPIGTRNVHCSPQDTSPNLPSCVFSVTLERIRCYHPPEPLHGSVTCAQISAATTTCSVKCNDYYDFFRRPQLMYTCFNGQWQLRQNNTWWPDCSRRMHPRRAYMKSYADYFYYGGTCEEVKSTIAQKFEDWIQSMAWEVCGAPSCPLENVQVSCGVQSRKRRNVRLLGNNSSGKNLNQKYPVSLSLLENSQLEILEGSTDVHRSKRNVNPHKSIPTTTPSVENHFPVFTGGRNSRGKVLMHPTISVTSENEVSYVRDEVIVEETHSHPSQAGSSGSPDSSATASVPYVTEIQRDADYSIQEVSTVSGTPTTEGHLLRAPENVVSTVQSSSSSSYESGDLTLTTQDVTLANARAYESRAGSDADANSLLGSISAVSRPEPSAVSASQSEGSEDDAGDGFELELGTPVSVTTPFMTTKGSDEQPAGTEDHPSGYHLNSPLRVRIAFTLIMSSNVSVMSLDDQMEIVDLLYSVVDAVDERLSQSRIALGGNNTSDVLVSASNLSYEDPQFDECELGQITVSEQFQTKTCVMCPVGTYSINITCLACPVGQFQDQEGQMECQQCPENTTTLVGGSTNISDCRGQCMEGYNSSTGLSPCTPCVLGTYQNVQGSQTCVPCEHGYTTAQEGSTSAEDCQPYCPAGSFGVGGIEPCELCPLNSFQPTDGRPECLLCPENKIAANLGAVSEDQCLDYNPCTANTIPPCENGGLCVSADHNSTMCVCPVGYTGVQCESDIQECNSNPCLNAGRCVDGIGNYTCQCSVGYTGRYCELDVDECLSSPCQNGGSCEDLEGEDGYRCHCMDGSTGLNCQVLDDCSYFDCLNGDPWMDDGFCRCSCEPGFLGVLCDILVDLCMTFPCENSRKCHTFQDDFECDCLPGYTGKTCSEEIDECEDEPCANGATCFDRQNSFYCKCPGGYSGLQCEQEVSPDFDLVFSQASSTNFVAMEREVIPIMVAVTICFWTRTHQMFGSGTIFSYSVPSHENDGNMATEFELSNKGELKLVISQEMVATGVSISPNVWHHVCVTWQCDGGVWGIYVNGSRLATGVGLGEGVELVGGGTLVIGQHQSSQSNIFNIWESFIGEITQFNVYDELLPLEQIAVLANQSSCDMSYGTVMSWTQVLDTLYGDLQPRNQSFCLDINECMMDNSFPCPPNHLCTDIIDGYNCSQCQYGYHGDSCQEAVDECMQSMCQNDASCTDGPEPWDFVCHCQSGYTDKVSKITMLECGNFAGTDSFSKELGQYCQEIIDFCESEPCMNQGVCLPMLGGYSCECQTSNSGPTCEDLGTSCWPSPCQHGGICTPHGDTFSCQCPEGYNGTHCEASTHRCQYNPCQNGGACEIQNGHPVCFCDFQWRGQHCEVRVVSDCSLSPCLNGGTCEQVGSEVGYLCRCNAEAGITLDIHCGYASPCLSNPCFDRGVCVSLPNNTYICDCDAGYSGLNCEIQGGVTQDYPSVSTSTPFPRSSPSTRQALCSPSTCFNGGTCRPVSGCECSLEYSGSQCQIQKHTVTSHYKGKVTLLVPYTTHNRQTIERDFDAQVEHALADLKSTGHLEIALTTLRPSADKSEMLAEFQIVFTQYVTSLTEKIDFMDIRNILHESVLRGQVGSFHTSIKGFQFKQSVQQDKSSSEDQMTLYLSVGLVCTIIMLVCVSVWVICKIHRHRKRQLTQSLLVNMNNAPNINLTMLTNPVFDHSDDDQLPRGSLAEENPYAEFGETIVPYEVTYSTKPSVKECNLARAAARKNSESSFTSVQASPSRKNKRVDSSKLHNGKESKDYLTPVVSKNELSHVEDVMKDDKKLLSNITKSGQTNQSCGNNDYLEPVKVMKEVPKCKNSNYVNVVQGHSEGQTIVESNVKGQGHLEPTDSFPYIDMQNTTKSKEDRIHFVNQQEDRPLITTRPLLENTSSPIDRLAYMINKPAMEGEGTTYLEPVKPTNPAEYLEIFPPKPSEMPPPDMSKRKLPPLPSNVEK